MSKATANQPAGVPGLTGRQSAGSWGSAGSGSSRSRLADLVVTGFGASVEIRTDDPAILEQVREGLPSGLGVGTAGSPDRRCTVLRRGSGPDAAGRYALLSDDGLILETGDRDELLAALEGELHFGIACSATTGAFIHAGAVSVNGEVILIPGRSRTGKTSLVKALVRAGATYFSDEYAVLDRDGRLHPFSRDLRVRTTEGFRSWRPERHGARVATAPAAVTSVLITRYRSGGRWEPDRVEPSEAMMALFANAVTARTRSALVLSVLGKAVQDVRAYRSVRGEAVQVVSWLGLSP